MLRTFIVGFIIIVLYVIQTAFGQPMTWGNVSPNLIMMFVCIYSLLRGRKEGMYAGFFAGILVDMFFGIGNTIGVNAFLYMMTGYVNGIFNEILYLEDIVIPVVSVAVSDLAYNFIYYIITFLVRNKTDFIGYLNTIMLPELVYTVLVAIILYRPVKYLNKKLEDFEKRGEKELD